MANTDPANEEPRTDPAISRRDFLRRAGREAAYTGTKLVPGAALAEKVLGVARPKDPASAAGPKDKPESSGLVERFASWRRRRDKCGDGGDGASE